MNKPRKRRCDAGRKRVELIHWIDHAIVAGVDADDESSFFVRRANRDTITLCGKRIWKKRKQSPASVSWTRELIVRSLDGTCAHQPRLATSVRPEWRYCKKCEGLANLTPLGRAVMLAQQNAKRSAAFGRLKSKAEEKKAAQLAELKARVEAARGVDAQVCLDAFETAFVQSSLGEDHPDWLKVQRCSGWITTERDENGSAKTRCRCCLSRADRNHVCKAGPDPIDVATVLALAVNAHQIEHASRGSRRWITRSIVEDDNNPDRRPTHCMVICRFCERTINSKWPLGQEASEASSEDASGNTYHVGRHTTRCALRYLLGLDVKAFPAHDGNNAVEESASV